MQHGEITLFPVRSNPPYAIRASGCSGQPGVSDKCRIRKIICPDVRNTHRQQPATGMQDNLATALVLIRASAQTGPGSGPVNGYECDVVFAGSDQDKARAHLNDICPLAHALHALPGNRWQKPRPGPVSPSISS